MSKVILHISDLHVTTHTKNDGVINSKIDSYLTTNIDESESNNYLKTFIDRIKADYPSKSFILLVTGDISNCGEIKEYDYSQKFLQKIIQELDVSKEDCLIIPGDHDVHRRSLENALEDAPNSQPYLLNDIKFRNFSGFYFKLKNENFPFEKIIIEHLIIENKVVLLAINSNYKISDSGGEGYIPIEIFNKEFEDLKANLKNENLQFVACWHHNFSAGYEDTNSGQWDPENRRYLLAELERLNIKLVLTGNEHTSSSKNVLMGSIKSSDCGAFSTIRNHTAFKVYPVIIDEKEIKLENHIYGLVKDNGNDTPYFWNRIDNTNARQPEVFVLYKKNEQVIDEVEDLPFQVDTTESKTTTVMPDSKDIIYDNRSIAENLYNIVREKKLFHSGHFHWSESSRAHNWIDVAKLLEDNEDFHFVQNAIIDIIETFDLAKNCNLIIGLGYEGNILSSKASIKYNIPYTSLPYSYRYNDHHDYEKKLNYENEDGSFRTVIIITDVVNDGRTVRKLIHEREKAFFEKVEKIIVLSLFYTGHEVISTDVLNFNKLPANYDSDSDYAVNNIEFYTVKSLRVEKCPYGKNYREECFIYKDELSCVHLFYDDQNG